MTSSHLQQWIEHPEMLNRETLYELRNLVARYPYFQSLRLLYLKNLYLLHDINFGAELRKAVLYVADRRVLFYLIEGDRYLLKSKKESQPSVHQTDEEPSVDRTLSLIDAFLATSSEGQPQNMELDYAMDYTAYLMEEGQDDASSEPSLNDYDEVPKLRGHELIDGFIRKSEVTDSPLFETRPLTLHEEEVQEEVSDTVGESLEAEPENVTLANEESDEPEEIEEQEEIRKGSSFSEEDLDDSCFTETLAKIYIKQHRYDKALEIIKKLSLNYPKKNAYFADQIRFLEKLIINAKSK